MIHNILFLAAFCLFLPQILFADDEIAIVLFVTGKVQYSQAGKRKHLRKMLY
ncbi:hypothetical protein LEP1GSC127_3315 [Leptospira kirschneri str. 200801925]|nr:hypothetical protein LEP1GSC127_3315 [Leptospira kirschneri str. 200801925]